MAQEIKKLSPMELASKQPGYHSDGANLYFRVTPSGAAGWIFRFTLNGRTRDMGLGTYPTVSLATARELAEKCRLQITNHVDPIEQRHADRAAARQAEARARAAEAKTKTFDECTEAYIQANDAKWRSAKHRLQWKRTLAKYASPKIGSLPVSLIDKALVLEVLQPIWYRRPETASRVRGRIRLILDWARAMDLRTGENPAAWKGYLDQIFPAREQVRPTEHRPALPFPELPAFISALRERQEDAAKALEFVILTAARTGEALRAQWDEIDFANKIWSVPLSRMKARKPHRVPLSKPALDVLEHMQQWRTNDFVFPGSKVGRPLSDMSLLMLLRRLGRRDITVHGFRSTFRDWAGETTSFPNHVVEMALAHEIGNAVEAAYRRGDLFNKRARLMDQWADYCSRPSGAANVIEVALERAKRAESGR
jgi:integrase